MHRKTVSGIILTLLLTSMLALAFCIQPVRAQYGGLTIYIRADGSVDPPDAPISTSDNTTYTFTDDFDGIGIVVERGNIVIDGNGYGFWQRAYGFQLSSVNNISIRNLDFALYNPDGPTFNLANTENVNIQNVYIIKEGREAESPLVSLTNAVNVTIQNSSIRVEYGWCIDIFSSALVAIIGNAISAYKGYSIRIFSSSFVTISQNSISLTADNLIDPSVRLDSISLDNCSYNNVTGNKITSSTFYKENGNGIILTSSSRNNIFENDIADANWGIKLDNSSDNHISRNNITNNIKGIGLSEHSTNNRISANKITSSDIVGIQISSSSNNLVYHNDFVQNVRQVDSQDSTNLWDNGYPSGGNYWIDYTDVDSYRGPDQNTLGSDGIWDHPYVIDADNRDRYPSVNPWMVKLDTTISFTLSPNPASPGQLITLLGNLTKADTDYAISIARVDVSVNGAFYASLWTNRSGWFKGSDYVGLGTYQINVTYAGSSSYDPSSHRETLIVQQPLESWIYFDFSPNPTTPSDTVTLKGILVDSQSIRINSGAVRVEYSTNDGASWNYIWTLTTNQYGMFSQSFPAPAVGRYLVRVSYTGDLAHKSCSNNAYFIVLSSVPRITTAGSVFFNFKPNPVKLGSTDVLRGILLDASNNPIKSAPVRVEYSINNGATWTYIWTLTTNQYGIFTNTLTAPSKGTYLMRASYSTSNITTYLLIQ